MLFLVISLRLMLLDMLLKCQSADWMTAFATGVFNFTRSTPLALTSKMRSCCGGAMVRWCGKSSNFNFAIICAIKAYDKGRQVQRGNNVYNHWIVCIAILWI